MTRILKGSSEDIDNLLAARNRISNAKPQVLRFLTSSKCRDGSD